MTESNDPRRAPGPPAEGEPPPTLPERLEGTVEAVGEAVERVEHRVEHAAEEVAQEVAEHVPARLRAPVRWTVKRLVLVIALGVVLVVGLGAFASAYYAWNHTEWAAHELAERVNRLLREHSNVELSVGGVRGNPLSTVDVIEPRIRWLDEPGDPVLEARSMRLSYSTWNLLSSRRGALVIELDRPVMRFGRTPDGRLRVPTWTPGAGRGGPGRGFDLVLHIRDGQVLMPDPDLSIEGFDLDARVETGDPTNVEVRSLAWKRGLYGLALERLRGRLVMADSVWIVVPELRGSDLELGLRARWKRGEATRDVEARIGRVSWSWLARVFRNKTLDVPGEGAFDVTARGDQAWLGEARGRADWAGLELESSGRFAWADGRLVLDPLSGTSAAGDLTAGRLTWSKQGWEVEGVARHADPAEWGVIGLKEWPTGRLEGRFHYEVDTRGPASSRLDAWLGPSSWTGWNVDSAQVRVMMPAGAADSFMVRASRRGGVVTLAARVQPEGWGGPYRIERFPLDEWPDGRASGISGLLADGQGRVDVSGGEMRVSGTLAGSATRWFGADIARWRMEDVRGRLLPTPDLEARARLEDVVYLGLHFDSAAAPVHLGDRSLVFPGLEAWAGDTLVTMSAGAEWNADRWRLVATRAGARSPDFEWIAEAPLELSGNAQGVTFDRLIAADGDARLEIAGRWAAPGGSYDWRARAARLRLDRLGLPSDLGLVGSADVELAVTGVSGDPRWELRGVARAPGLRGHRADSLDLRVSGGPSRLEVGEFRMALGGGVFEGQGEVRGTERPWPDTLTAAGVTRWIAAAAAWNGKLRASQVPLERLTALAGRDVGWRGRLGGTLSLGGRPSHPEFDLSLDAKPVEWRNVRMDAIEARAEYRDERLRLTRLRAMRDQAVSTITGEIDLELAVGREPQVLDAPMRWKVSLPSGDLVLLPLLVQQVGAAAGRFEVDAEVRGTARRPEVFGTARIREGRLRIAGRGELLDRLRAKVRFEGSKVVLDSLTATEPSQFGGVGRVFATGMIDLRADPGPSYAFDLSLRDFTAVEEGIYAARFDGTFRITNGRRFRGKVLPHVTSDNVEVRHAVISYDFTRQTEQQQVQASTMPLYWTYRIQVHATDNLFWRPTDGDIEFSADLSLDQSPEGLLIFGDMEALRGSYYFLSNRFTVHRATLTFDDVGGVDPIVDAEATTRLALSQPVETGGSSAPAENTNITVTIQGRSSRPVVSFDSDPVALDQNQILQELTVGRFRSGQQVELSDPFDSYLTRAISRQLSAELSRTFRGYLTDWEIARESEGTRGLMLRVGSQISDQLVLRYGQLLPGTGRVAPGPATTLVERDIEAQVRLNRYFYLTSQLAQKRVVTGSASSTNATPDFNVNLKARWEY